MACGMAEDLVCPICLSFFQEPHMLGCGHNFCLACLRGALPAGQAEGTCPECRGPFRLPELQRNRALGSLAAKVRRWQGDEALLPSGSAVGRWHFCEAHDEPLKLFCCQDEAPLCVICRDLAQHHGHRFLPVPDAAREAQGKLKAYLKPLEKHLKYATEDETDQLKEIEALKNCTEDLVGHISKEFEALHQVLREKEQDIKLMVEKMKEENMEEMEDSLTSLKEEVSSRTATIAKVKAALEMTDQVAFLKDLKELMEQVKEDHQGEVEDYEDTEETSEDEAEEKSDQEENSEEPCKNSNSEDEDDEDYKPEEESHDGDDRVVPVEPYLESFGESLNFETWKEMLEGIKPRLVS